MKIIPAIDIINGQCVRLSEGDFATSKVYYSDPLEAARSFEQAGLEYLHLVDLDGAKQRKVANWDILERIASSTYLKIDFSGGISSKEDVERALKCGASQVAVGSLAARETDTVIGWIEHFGHEKIILGADVRKGMITTHGWQEVSDIDIIDFIRQFEAAGGNSFLCTDVSKDGLLSGPSTTLYQRILKLIPGIHLIASGGVSSMQDLVDLKEAGCSSAIIGKAIYEDRISLQELNEFSKHVN